MVRAILLTLVLWPIVGCAEGTAAPEPRNHAEAFACYEAFESALEGWEEFEGPVPDRCRYLDTSYSLSVQEDLGCAGSTPDTIGCHNGTRRWIHIRPGLTPERTVGASVHEWMHALSECVYGHPDHGHENPSVFGYDRGQVPEYVGNQYTAQRYAIARAPVGPCLETP